MRKQLFALLAPMRMCRPLPSICCEKQLAMIQHRSGVVGTALDTWSDASSETRPGLELAACKTLGIPAALQPSNHPARTAYSVLLRKRVP